MSTSANPEPSARQALKVAGLKASYGPVQVLHGIDFEVEAGEIAVILGANGAGKTTTLRAICGMVDTAGSVELNGNEISGYKTPKIVRAGVAHVPQGRGTFPELSVVDNLMAGAFVRKDNDVQADLERWLDVFPVLSERRTQAAGSLSGGEQQMLAVARALMSRPNLLLLDEPSLGLAPLITEQIFAKFREVNEEDGTTMLIVEQNATLALSIARTAYVLEAGQVALSGPASELQDNEDVRRAYLGY